MDISFRHRKFEQECSSESQLRKVHGPLAKVVKLRLDALRAAENLAEVDHRPPTRRHKLVGDLKGYFAVDINRNRRLVFLPLNVDQGKEFELKEVVAIEIIAIIDYH